VSEGVGKRNQMVEEPRNRQWRKGALAAGAAIALQVAIIGLALLVGVLDPAPPRETLLKVPPGSPIVLRERRREANDQIARLNRMKSDSLKRLMDPVIDATRPDLPLQRPDLVQSVLAMGSILPVGDLFQASTEAFGTAMDEDALPPPDPVEFLGETLTAKRIVLLLDVSGSVKSKMERAGLSMDQLRREVASFINQLGPNHLFGIIQFTRNWQAFRDQLVPATGEIKQAAHEWMNGSFRTTGTAGSHWTHGSPNGIEGVLAAAFAMDPHLDEVFLLSDADFQRTPPGGGGQDVPWPQLRGLTRSLQDQSISTTRLRVLCFFPPQETLPDLRAWVSENGPGTLRITR
jgi:hypothetical protein